MAFRFAPARPATITLEAMVATSQPLATRAGVRALERGGNAVDAAIAAAAVLCVTEPMSTGVGGDVFALLWKEGRLHALDAAGPSPRVLDDPEPAASGPRSVDVPGAVAGWAELAARHGRLGLDACLRDAVDLARRGFAVASHTARMWGEAERLPEPYRHVPAAGDRIVSPELAATLGAIAAQGPEAFYAGPVAEAICAVSWLELDDLAAFAPRWVEPLRLAYHGLEVVELPPPTQGVAALEALGIYDGLEPGLASQVGAVRLALEDAFASVRDGADVAHLLTPEHLARRRAARPAPLTEPAGGTVYLCVVDGERTAVSFIQSLFGHFGSGVAAPGTGVVLNNRGAGFAIAGQVEPGVRPYHTIIPGLLLREGALLGPFGIMGGFVQAQAHLQFVAAVADDGCDPQAALDRPRFRIEADEVLLEPGHWDGAAEVERLGLRAVRVEESGLFGGGQAIFVEGASLRGGSDARRDGHAAGF